MVPGRTEGLKPQRHLTCLYLANNLIGAISGPENLTLCLSCSCIAPIERLQKSATIKLVHNKSRDPAVSATSKRRESSHLGRVTGITDL
jgi:hypothetical protein